MSVPRPLRVSPSWQFLRYLLVGGWNTAFGYGTFVVLTWLISRHVAHGYLYAAVLSRILNITVAFLGYKWFVFKTKGNYLREWARSFVVYGTAAIPNLILLPVVVNLLIYVFHVPPDAQGRKTAFEFSAHYLSATFFTAPYIAGAFLIAFTVVYSFFGHKHFSFRAKKELAAGSSGAQQ